MQHGRTPVVKFAFDRGGVKPMSLVDVHCDAAVIMNLGPRGNLDAALGACVCACVRACWGVHAHAARTMGEKETEKVPVTRRDREAETSARTKAQRCYREQKTESVRAREKGKQSAQGWVQVRLTLPAVVPGLQPASC